jgi:hypothetical protein
MCRGVNRHMILENNMHELKFVGKFLVLYFKDTWRCYAVLMRPLSVYACTFEEVEMCA